MGDVRGERIRDQDDFLVFGSPLIEEPEIAEVLGTLRSGWLGTGPKVAKFEQDFGRYVESAHAVAVNSCTAALHLSMLASGLAPGDEVVTTPLTFCATINAIIHAGAKPVLADVDASSMNLDPVTVEAALTERSRAVLPVHFAGRPCDMASISALARRYDLTVIEDCAHAIETLYQGRHVGTFGDFGCFSFYVTKNVVTGEGGMVVTSDEERATRIKVLALHGMTKDAWRRFSDSGFRHYDVIESGFKYNMMDMQAALGIHQLERVERSWKRRQAIWQTYQEELADVPVGRPAEPEPATRHGYHLYTILVDPERCGLARDEVLEALTWHGIGVGVHYRAIPELTYYRDRFGWAAEDYPNATRIGRQTVSLPLSARLTDDDVRDVVRAVRRVVLRA